MVEPRPGPARPNFIFAKMMKCSHDMSTLTRGSERSGIRCTSPNHPADLGRGSRTIQAAALEAAGRTFLAREFLDKPLDDLVTELAQPEIEKQPERGAEIQDMTRTLLSEYRDGFQAAAREDDIASQHRWLQRFGFQALCDGAAQEVHFRLRVGIPTTREFNGYKHHALHFTRSLAGDPVQLPVLPEYDDSGAPVPECLS